MKNSQEPSKIGKITPKTALIFATATLFPLTALGQLVQNPIVTQFFLDLLGILTKAIAAITGAVSIIVIIAAAFLYMTAGGNVEVIKRAHKMILYSLAGVAIALMLTTLPTLIQNFFGSTAQQVAQQPPVQQPPVQQPPVQQPPVQQPPVQQPPSACTNCTKIITQNVAVKPQACCTSFAPAGAAPGSWSCPQYESLLNCQVSNTHIQQLGQLAQAIPSANFWRVTEAWPPTVVHQNACHLRATCTDANFTSTSYATPANISNFIQQSQNAGITPIYEVTTATRRQTLINSGVPANNIQVVPGINSEHFSLYSCSNFQTGC